jgi:hypothetical protein
MRQIETRYAMSCPLLPSTVFRVIPVPTMTLRGHNESPSLAVNATGEIYLVDTPIAHVVIGGVQTVAVPLEVTDVSWRRSAG